MAINITVDLKLIRSYLERPDCIDGFGKLTDDQLMSLNCIYFYEEGVGLFPATIEDNVIMLHAAIPKENRGIKTIRATRKLAEFLTDNGYTVMTKNNEPYLKRFVQMVGGEFVERKNGLDYWVYRGKSA